MSSNFNKTESEDNKFIEENIGKITLECLKKIKSTSLVLNNSFFCITNSNLIVLKCFLNKNSDNYIQEFLPKIGQKLCEDFYDKKSIISNIYNSELMSHNKEHEFIKMKSIIKPIKYKDRVIAYINFTTLNNYNTVFPIFIESFVLNIEKGIREILIVNEINKYLKLIDINSEYKYKEEKLLSMRENLISKYMLMAYSNSEIAHKLFISESTVKTYLRRIYEKCGTNNRISTVVAIICNNILHKL